MLDINQCVETLGTHFYDRLSTFYLQSSGFHFQQVLFSSDILVFGCTNMALTSVTASLSAVVQ